MKRIRKNCVKKECKDIGKKRRQLTSKENFIKRAINIHGNKYDYSGVSITKMKDKVNIRCNLHGLFVQEACSHLSGHGCMKCRDLSISAKFRSNIEDFIIKSQKVHGYLYDYSQVGYVNAHKKVLIICREHGKFLQSPNKHLAGKGCLKCAGRNRTTKDFIIESNKIHNNYFDYSLTSYKSAKEKVKIVCPKHGLFIQTPDSHLRGKKCIKCSHSISRLETEFLNYLNIKNRNIRLKEWKTKAVDGFDIKTNTVYEFLGDYWHGNPCKYHPKDTNTVSRKRFQDLLKITFDSLNKLKRLGYNVKYIWESDWLNFKNGIDKEPKIIFL